MAEKVIQVLHGVDVPEEIKEGPEVAGRKPFQSHPTRNTSSDVLLLAPNNPMDWP